MNNIEIGSDWLDQGDDGKPLVYKIIERLGENFYKLHSKLGTCNMYSDIILKMVKMTPKQAERIVLK